MMKWQPLSEYFLNHYSDEAVKAVEFSKRRTGFSNLDGTEKFHSEGQKQVFAPGLYVVGALPSAGKTTWTLQLSSQLADRGEEVLFLSYEQSVQTLCRKLIARELFEKKKEGEPVTVLSGADIRRAGTTNEDINAVVGEFANTMNHLRILHVDWEAKQLIHELRSFASTLARPPCVFLDYLQMVPSKDAATPKDKVDSLLSALRKFQVDTDATLFLISSFNRSNSMQSEASFSSFKESGGIEFSADVMLVLEPAIKGTESTSEADRRERQKKVRAMRLRCLKYREGALYEVFFRYHAAYDTFEPCFKNELFDEDGEPPRHYK